MSRCTVRVVVTAAFAALLALVAGPAYGHVTVEAPEAAPGATAELTFRVESEEPSSPTTKFEVALPADPPLTRVEVPPVEGWKSEVKREGGVARRVVWTATGGGIAPEKTADFAVVAGPLPSNDMVFNALQTYADGTVMRWIQAPVAGAEEPDRPAPVLRLGAGAADRPAAGGSSAVSPWLLAGGGAVLLGLLAVLALLLRRRRSE